MRSFGRRVRRLKHITTVNLGDEFRLKGGNMVRVIKIISPKKKIYLVKDLITRKTFEVSINQLTRE